MLLKKLKWAKRSSSISTKIGVGILAISYIYKIYSNLIYILSENTLWSLLKIDNIVFIFLPDFYLVYLSSENPLFWIVTLFVHIIIAYTIGLIIISSHHNGTITTRLTPYIKNTIKEFSVRVDNIIDKIQSLLK